MSKGMPVDIPPHLRLLDSETLERKPLLDDFSPEELFFRSYPLEMSSNVSNKKPSKFPGSTLKFPDCSVDWSRLSSPQDRWIYKPKQGIVEFAIGHAWFCHCPTHRTLSPLHEPVESPDPENYAHCVIIVSDEDARRLKAAEVTEEDNKFYRTLIARFIKPWAQCDCEAYQAKRDIEAS